MPRPRATAVLVAIIIWISLVLLWPAAAGAATPPPPGPMTDVPANHWAAAAIAQLWQAGIINGDERGYFYPDRPISRAELAKVVILSLRLAPQPVTRQRFSDVPAAAWYAGFTETAYRLALLHAQADGLLNPNGQVSREELAMILDRALAWEKVAQDLSDAEVWARLNFSDRGDISSRTLNYVAQAVRGGVLRGFGDGTFRPGRAATRAEVAVIAQRLLRPDSQSIVVTGRQVPYLQRLDLVATAYGAGEDWLSDTTYLGLQVHDGVVAVDPSVIPLGSLLYVDGYGFAIAADTGSAIRGARIDLYYGEDPAFVRDFGLQPRKVYLIQRPVAA